MTFKILVLLLSICSPIISMDYASDSDSDSENLQLVGHARFAHDITHETGYSKECFICHKLFQPQDKKKKVQVQSCLVSIHTDCAYDEVATVGAGLVGAVREEAQSISKWMQKKINTHSLKFDSTFATSVEKQRFIIAHFLEGALCGSSAYASYAIFTLEHLSGFRWWLLQSAGLLIPDKFLDIFSNPHCNTLFKQCSLLGLAYCISRKQNMAHLLLLSSANLWLKPVLERLAQSVSSSKNYEGLKQKLASNHKQKAIWAAGVVVGFGIVAPMLNNLLARGCEFATNKAGQLIAHGAQLASHKAGQLLKL